jgi:hypothetical protein
MADELFPLKMYLMRYYPGPVIDNGVRKNISYCR